MEKQKRKFNIENFKKQFRKFIKDLEYKRYNSIQNLNEIKSILKEYYQENEEVRKYFKDIGISYHFCLKEFQLQV